MSQRTKLTEERKAQMADVFRANPQPEKEERIQIALITGLSETQVAGWFARERRRVRSAAMPEIDHVIAYQETLTDKLPLRVFGSKYQMSLNPIHTPFNPDEEVITFDPKEQLALEEARRQKMKESLELDLSSSLVLSNTEDDKVESANDDSPDETAFEKILGDCLDDVGGVTPQHLPEFMKLMKDSKSLVARFLVLAALEESRSSILERFLTSSGLSILNQWLKSSAKGKQDGMIRAILKLLKIMPVTMDILKDTSIGKTVKKVAKISDYEKVGNQVMEVWMKRVARTVKREREPEPIPPAKRIKRAEAHSTKETVTKQPKQAKAFSAGSAAEANPMVRRSVAVINNSPAKSASKNSLAFTSRPVNVDDVRKAKARQQRLMQIAKEQEEKTREKKEKKLQMEADQAKAKSSPKDTEETKAMDVDEKDQESISSSGERTPAPVRKKEEFSTPKATTGPLIPALKGTPGSRGKKTKVGIKWSPNLETVRMFKPDRSAHLSAAERQSFQAAAALEYEKERASLLERRQLEQHDASAEIVPSIEWYTPKPIELPSSVFPRTGANSKEAPAENDRQSRVLAVHYLTKEQMPPHPVPISKQVEEEDYDDSQTTVIPLNVLYSGTSAASVTPPAVAPVEAQADNFLAQLPAAPTYQQPAYQQPSAGSSYRSSNSSPSYQPNPSYVHSSHTSPPYHSAHGSPPYQSSHGSPPYQSSHGSPPYQSTHGSPPYQSSHGSPPYQASHGSPPYNASPYSSSASPPPYSSSPGNYSPTYPSSQSRSQSNWDKKNGDYPSYGKPLDLDPYAKQNPDKSKDRPLPKHVLKKRKSKHCRFWNTPSGCKNGAKCHFLHE